MLNIYSNFWSKYNSLVVVLIIIMYSGDVEREEMQIWERKMVDRQFGDENWGFNNPTNHIRIITGVCFHQSNRKKKENSREYRGWEFWWLWGVTLWGIVIEEVKSQERLGIPQGASLLLGKIEATCWETEAKVSLISHSKPILSHQVLVVTTSQGNGKGL